MPKGLNFNRPRGSMLSQWQGPRSTMVSDQMNAAARSRAFDAAMCRAKLARRFENLEAHPELKTFVAAAVSAAGRRKSGKAPITLPKLACLEKIEDA